MGLFDKYGLQSTAPTGLFQKYGEVTAPEEQGFRQWMWNLLRRVPQVVASMPTTAMPPPMKEPIGQLSKVVEPIRKKVESLPVFAPLKKLEEQIFAEGRFHKPEIMPETEADRIRGQIRTVTQAPSIAEGLMDFAEQLPGVGTIPRSIRTNFGTWYTDPLPNIMDLAMLMGGWEAVARAKAPKTLEMARVETPVEIETSVGRVIEALKEAKPLRKEQEALYTKERSARFARARQARERVGGGEKGYYAELGQMKGEMPKVKSPRPEFESIREKLSQADFDNLFDAINRDTRLGMGEGFTAKRGLAKIFGEFGGKVPTESEIVMLNRIFGSEFTKAVLKKRGFWAKAKEAGWQIANIPRSIMASFDVSAPLRQGIFLISQPKQFFGAFGDMFKAFGSERGYQAVMESIKKKSTYPLMKESKLALTELERSLTGREEAFMSNWAEKIPGVGRGVRASGRAHTAFLNKLRADAFQDLILKAEKAGVPRTPDMTKALADFLNNATGRGSLGKLQRSATMLNTFFFSPRLMASRLRLLNPAYYAGLPKFVRKQALKSLMAYTGSVGSVLTLAKMAGAEVNLDPRNANFGKILIGKTRVDIMGGFQQYIRAAAQFFGKQYISSITGKKVTLGEGYKAPSRWDILLRQIESKQAPAISFVVDLMKGQDWKGEPVNIPKELGERLVPMVIADMVDIAREDPELLPLGIPAMFGVGLQTYELYSPQVREFNRFLSDAEGIARIHQKLPAEYKASFAMENRQMLGAMPSLRSLSRRMSDLRKQIDETTDPARKSELERQIEMLAEMGLRLKIKRETPFSSGGGIPPIPPGAGSIGMSISPLIDKIGTALKPFIRGLYERVVGVEEIFRDYDPRKWDRVLGVETPEQRDHSKRLRQAVVAADGADEILELVKRVPLRDKMEIDTILHARIISAGYHGKEAERFLQANTNRKKVLFAILDGKITDPKIINKALRLLRGSRETHEQNPLRGVPLPGETKNWDQGFIDMYNEWIAAMEMRLIEARSRKKETQ